MNFQFQCTAEHCQAILVIRMRAPHLRDDQLRLLTDTVLLEARKEAAVRTDPARFDEFQTAKPVETLGVLHAYFRDSLDLTRPTSRRRVPVRNRLFMLSFGSDCDKLLEDLGFRYGVRMQSTQISYHHSYTGWNVLKFDIRLEMVTPARNISGIYLFPQVVRLWMWTLSVFASKT